MRKRFPTESESYNELMLNISNSNILSMQIKTFLEQKIIHLMNSSKKAAINKLSFKNFTSTEEYFSS